MTGEGLPRAVVVVGHHVEDVQVPVDRRCALCKVRWNDLQSKRLHIYLWRIDPHDINLRALVTSVSIKLTKIHF